MNQAIVDKMIPFALKEAKKFETKPNSNEIESKYLSGIANFGVSVLSSGAKATILFYNAKDGKYELIPKSILKIIHQYNADTSRFDTLYKYTEEADSRDRILDASTALKLAMRSFEKVDNIKGKQDE